MDNLYQDNILDHAHNPRNKVAQASPLALSSREGVTQESFVCGEGDNPSCGDSGQMCVSMGTQIGDLNVVTDVQWYGTGCAISQASMSIVSEYIKGKSVHDLKLLMPGDIYQLLGIQITPSRVNCALLPYLAVEKILEIC